MTKDVIEAGEPLMQEALEALRAYHEAQAEGRSTEEVERLRVVADERFKATSDYQQQALREVLHVFHCASVR